ncbi:MAG: hypothetical protein GY869_13615 [Planctomycetes bacterium]|nr:hypothetical protein [Planctomycetota bacterium]
MLRNEGETTMGKFPMFMSVIGLVTASVLLCGCGSSMSLTSDVPDIFVDGVHAHQNGDETVINGQVKRSLRNCCDSARGHVDIAVFTPDGFVIDMFSALFTPRNIPKVRTRSSNFEVLRPYTLDTESTIRLAYHGTGGIAGHDVDRNGVFQCANNMALPENTDGRHMDINPSG